MEWVQLTIAMMLRVLEHMIYGERLRIASLFSLEKPGGGIIAIFQYPWGEEKKEESNSSQNNTVKERGDWNRLH